MTDHRTAEIPAAAPPRTGPPWHYRAFGLRLRSDIPVAAFEPAPPGPADVTVERLEGAPPARGERQVVRFDFESGQHMMGWAGVGDYHLLGLDRIGIRPAPEAEPGLLDLPLVGPVLATLLHLRGALVLHASAVSVGGAAHVLMGDKRAGKSTLAAALVAAGHPLIADDVVAIRFDGEGRPIVAPAFGQMKLTEEAVRALSLDLRARGRVLDTTGKRAHACAGLLSGEDVPVRALHVLARGDGPELAAFPTPEALAHLARFSYARRFGSAALPRDIAARHFRDCVRVAGSAHVGRLDVPDGLDRLPETVAALERAFGAG